MAPIYQASQADKTHKQAFNVVKKKNHWGIFDGVTSLVTIIRKPQIELHNTLQECFNCFQYSHKTLIVVLHVCACMVWSITLLIMLSCVSVCQMCLYFFSKATCKFCQVQFSKHDVTKQDECWCEIHSIRVMPGFVFMAKARLSSRITPALCK